jgi:uncharacterized protein YggE
MHRNRLVVLAALTVVAVAIGLAVVLAEGSSPDRATGAAAAATTNTVSVSGTGSVEGVPDTLVANLRVHVGNLSTVQTALNASATDTHAVISRLRAKGVAAADIKTTNLSLNPHYDSHGVVTGYDSSEALTVRIHPLTKVGEIISAAAPQSAGNAVSIDGLSFDISDNSTLLNGARAAAFANAKTAAGQYAKLGGRTLDHVVSINAQVHNASPIRGYATGAGAATLSSLDKTAAVPIRPGQQKISVTVKVVWALN